MRKNPAISLPVLFTVFLIFETGGSARGSDVLQPIPAFLDSIVIPPQPRTYTADEVDALLKKKGEELDKAKAELNTTMAADHEAIRKQISEGLSALQQNLITEEVKQKLTDDVATLVQQRVSAQVDEMKAEMKAELLTAFTEKMEQIKK